MIGKKIEIISVSRKQQYDDHRPVDIGDRGTVSSQGSAGTWYINLIDPKDNKEVLIWFHEFDFKIIKP